MSFDLRESRSIGNSIRALCYQCSMTTNHRIVKAVDYSWIHEEDPSIRGGGSAQIIQCQGCDTLSFRQVRYCTEDPEPEALLYPERVDPELTRDLYLRGDVYGIPEIVRTIYKETLSAFTKGFLTLAGIGIRAVIEATCQERKAKRKTLEGRINELADMSLLTPEGAKILHGIRLLGNIAAHEMKAPRREQIVAALRVIDHLLLGVYVLPEEASILPKPKPKLAKKPKKSVKRSRTGGTRP